MCPQGQGLMTRARCLVWIRISLSVLSIWGVGLRGDRYCFKCCRGITAEMSDNLAGLGRLGIKMMILMSLG